MDVVKGVSLVEAAMSDPDEAMDPRLEWSAVDQGRPAELADVRFSMGDSL